MNKSKTFSEIVGLSSVDQIDLPGADRHSAIRLPVNIASENYKIELSGDVKSHPFCEEVYSRLENFENSIIGILQREYDTGTTDYYDGQFFPFPDIPKLLQALEDVTYARLPWQNIEENVGEIYYKKVFPHKIFSPSGRSSSPPVSNIDITLENFLSDLPENYTGYPVFQMFEFTNKNYTLFRTKEKTPEQIRQLDQNYSSNGTSLPSNSVHEGHIDISFDGGSLDGFGEDRSFAEFLGNDGVYYLNAKTGRRHQNTLAVISIHFFNPSIRPGQNPYKYEQTYGQADNPETSSSIHSGPVSHQSICDIKIRLKSPPKI